MNIESESEISYSRASEADANPLSEFLQSFVDEKQLLPRTVEELRHLTKFAWIARWNREIVGFSAVEVYSRKLAELQCMAVSLEMRRCGVGQNLVRRCVELAREQGVLELMAISSSDEFLRSCGFGHSLPQQKRAFFIQPGEGARDAHEQDSGS